jgi:hypothetical protein
MFDVNSYSNPINIPELLKTDNYVLLLGRVLLLTYI